MAARLANFPRNDDTANYFANWKCSVCHEEDPTISGGTVAHDPTHPIHRDCIVTWLDRELTCPNCKVNVDPSAIMPYSRKAAAYALRAFHGVENYFSRMSTASRLLYGGLPLIYLGWATGLQPITALGFAAQCAGTHKGLQFGTHRVAGAREIHTLADAISVDIQRGVSEPEIAEKIAQLKGLMNSNTLFNAERGALGEQLDSVDQRGAALFRIKQIAFSDVFSDLFLRGWKAMGGLGALYYAAKSITG